MRSLSASFPQGCFLCSHGLAPWMLPEQTLAGCARSGCLFFPAPSALAMPSLPRSQLRPIFLGLFQIWVTGLFCGLVGASLLGWIVRKLCPARGDGGNSWFKKLAPKVQTTHLIPSESRTNRKLLQRAQLFEIPWLLNSASGDFLFLWFRWSFDNHGMILL